MMRLMPLLLVLVLLFASPVVVLILSAASSSWSFPQVAPSVYDWRSLDYLLRQRGDIAMSLLGSSAYSLCAVLLTIIMTLPAAKAFARTDFRGKVLLEGLLLTPALVPPMSFAMGAHFLFLHLGIADTFFGVVLMLSLCSYPYMLRALTAGYQSHNENVVLCARNIGASWLRILLAIELPLLLPSMVAGGVIVFLVSFSEYFLVFLIGGGSVPSYSGYIFPMLNASDKSVASLLTLLFLAVPLLLFVLLDRLVHALYRRRGVL